MCDSPDGMGLIRLEAAHGGLQEGGDGGGGQVGGELGAHPQAAPQQEGVHGTVQVGQHHPAQKVSDVKVYVPSLEERERVKSIVPDPFIFGLKDLDPPLIQPKYENFFGKSINIHQIPDLHLKNPDTDP